MDKIKIMVALHKPAPVFQDEIYTPIQVGKALSKYNLPYQGDNTGDNISLKNPYYSELTAQYWGWKNLHCEYIGLCHYRRYFIKKFTIENIDNEMKDCDIILVNPLILPNSILKFWSIDLIPEDIAIFYLFMRKKYPHEKDFFENYFTQMNKFYPCNMFVCKKELFDKFANWQFSTLQDLEKILPFSKYSRPNRILGYLGEGLLPYYAHLQHWKIKTMKIVSMLGEKKSILEQPLMKKVVNNIFFNINKKPYKIGEAIRTGLQNDGFLNGLI